LQTSVQLIRSILLPSVTKQKRRPRVWRDFRKKDVVQYLDVVAPGTIHSALGPQTLAQSLSTPAEAPEVSSSLPRLSSSCLLLKHGEVQAVSTQARFSHRSAAARKRLGAAIACFSSSWSQQLASRGRSSSLLAVAPAAARFSPSQQLASHRRSSSLNVLPFCSSSLLSTTPSLLHGAHAQVSR
jgi:hypothetical protein